MRNSQPTSQALLRWIIHLSIFVIALFTFWRWLHPDSLRVISGRIELIDTYGGMERLALWQKVAGFTIDAIPAALLIWALFQLLFVLRLMREEIWFDERTEKSFTIAGRSMLWFVLASWLNETLLVLIMTANNPPGERMLVVSASSNELLSLVPALMALVIARMIRLAREQREELNQII